VGIIWQASWPKPQIVESFDSGGAPTAFRPGKRSRLQGALVYAEMLLRMQFLEWLCGLRLSTIYTLKRTKFEERANPDSSWSDKNSSWQYGLGAIELNVFNGMYNSCRKIKGGAPADKLRACSLMEKLPFDSFFLENMSSRWGVLKIQRRVFLETSRKDWYYAIKQPKSLQGETSIVIIPAHQSILWVNINFMNFVLSHLETEWDAVRYLKKRCPLRNSVGSSMSSFVCTCIEMWTIWEHW
jgi:hypothetical protein